MSEDKLQQGKTVMLLTVNWETCSTGQIIRMKHARNEENETTVDEMVGLLNHKGQKQTYRSTHQISKLLKKHI